MPRIVTKRSKPPAGYEDIRADLDDFTDRMRDAEYATDGDPKETLHKIRRIEWERTRYIYQGYYTKKTIKK
ncbi:G10 protein [Kipferlia bialata]|uniref:G10 protein n=1 Tax=Kipferlia bialata TaxID=797122 RepID=A0A9K3CRA7_9EUKA|nr:G10 protein [Kipferlia bialata]|eukprot:g2860.t1